MKDKTIVRKILPYFFRYKFQIAGGFILLLLSAILSLVLPLMVESVVNDIANVTLPFFGLLATVIVLSMICESVSTYLFAVTTQKVARDIRVKAWTHVLTMKVIDLQKRHSGEISSRIISDVGLIIGFFSNELPATIVGLISICIALILMFSIDMVITIILICLTPLIIFTIKPISNKVYQLSEEMQAITADVNSFFTETIAQNKLIKAYGAEHHEYDRGLSHINRILGFGKKYAKIQAMLSPIMGGIITILVIAVVGIGAYRVHSGFLSGGALVAFALYIYQIIQPIQTIGSFLIEREAVNGSAKELFNIIEIEGEDLAKGENIPLNGNIKFKNVSFYYNKDQSILDDVNFCADYGKKTAIVGESGAGKTTIFSLIDRFYEVQSGEILIDGHNVNELSLSQLRKSIGYVSQDNIIISGTILENITYGCSREVTTQEIQEVIKAANLKEYIDSLPDGPNTIVGERGNFLSGGQKQRVAIARALLQNPKYLLLDEATANLDTDSEKAVATALENLLHGRTSIIISHHLSSIIKADKILVLRAGRIVGEGTHKELLQNNEYYQHIVTQQYVQENQGA